MSGDLVIEHIQGILSYVHDDRQPRSSALLLIHFEESADAYVRHTGYLHRFIGRVPEEVRDQIRAECSRAFVTYIPASVVEDTYKVELVHWSEKEVQSSMTNEIAAMWSMAAKKYGLDERSEASGRDILIREISSSFQSGGHQEPFGDLIGVKRSLEGNGPFGELKEVIGQPIGGLAGARIRHALNDFVASSLVRN